MPQVARVGDADTNHAPCPAGSCQTGSPNVLANNIAVHRAVSYTHLTLPTSR